MKQIKIDEAKHLHSKATTAFEKGTPTGYEDAIRLWRQAAHLFHEAEKYFNEGIAYFNMGEIYSRLNDYQKQIHCFKLSVPAIEKEKDPQPSDVEVVADAYRRIGKAYSALAERDSALAYFQKSLSIFEKTNNRSYMASVLDDLGREYVKLKRYTPAMEHLKRANQMFRELDDQLGVQMTATQMKAIEMGQVSDLIDEGEYDNAMDLTNKILQTNNLDAQEFLKIFPQIQDESNKALLKEQMTTDELEQVKDALETNPQIAFYQAARLVNKRLNNPRDEAQSIYMIGMQYLVENKPENALIYFFNALSIQDDIGDVFGKRETLSTIAQTYHRRLSPPNLSKALEYYAKAADVRFYSVQRAGEDPNRISMAEQDAQFYGEWVLANLSLKNQIGEKDAAYAALAAAERGRAQALRGLLGKDERQKVNTDLVSEGKNIVHNAGVGNATVLKYLLTSDQLIIWVIQPPSGTIKVIQQGLASASLIEEAKKRNWVILESALRNSARMNLSAMVAGLRKSLGVDDAATQERVTHDRGSYLENNDELRNLRPLNTRPQNNAALDMLSKYLLPEEAINLLPQSGEIVIVPHGSINLVPFSALKIGNNTLLGLKYALRYSPSLGVLDLINLTDKSPTSKQFSNALVMGNPTMPLIRTSENNKVQLSDLPGAKIEATAVAQAFGINPLTGDDADETTFYNRAGQADIIHLATHGFAYSSEDQVRHSFIALAPAGNNDGFLTLGEVIDKFDFKAELVTLSACQTGLGNIRQAEGTVGLQRAFLGKGARSVLVSLWSVSDEATRLLMEKFYAYWLDKNLNLTKSEALRRAQIDVRNDQNYKHPRFWAAFQLVGAE